MPKISQCTSKFEEELLKEGYRFIAGVDEVGRGALAGPVVAGAVILDLGCLPSGLDDSKRLTRKQRERLAVEIGNSALAMAIARIEPEQIDTINIHQASLKAMREAIAMLEPVPDYLLIDGFPLKSIMIPHRAVIGGDALSVSIAAASIIAKVERDRIMNAYDSDWPGYGLSKNVGYATVAHLDGLRRLGPTPIHRHTFNGVLRPAQLELPIEVEGLEEVASKDG
jgi:ribonuclease HII